MMVILQKKFHRLHLSAASSEHNTHILRSGMPGLPASDL